MSRPPALRPLIANDRRRRIAELDQVFRGRDEVGERIQFLMQFASAVPTVAELSSSPNMSDDDDETPVQQTESLLRKSGFVNDSITAVTEKEARPRDVERESRR